MKRTRIFPEKELFPEEFRSLLDCPVFDSSSSPEARVYFLDRETGLFLKVAPPKSLEKEAKMTSFFHRLGLSSPVLTYITKEKDYLLTQKVPGEDGTSPLFLKDPVRLTDTLALLLRELHEKNGEGCPVPFHT